jgi:hypothetical protein
MLELAKPEDVPQVYALCIQNYNENNTIETGIRVSFEKSFKELEFCVQNNFCVVERKGKEINGLLLLKPAVTTWFSEDEIFMGLIFYIKPDFRTFKLAKSLLTAAKEYAIINKLPIAFDLFAQKDASKKKKLFEYMGFKEWGSFYLYNPMWDHVEQKKTS